MSIRILLLAQWFEPEPTFKGLLFAKELVRQGFQVEVLTGFPNYPGGKIYKGYKIRWRQVEVMEGIPIIRAPLYPSHDRSVLGRVLNYVSFSLTAFFHGLRLARRADVIYAYHPPLTVGVSAVMLRLFSGTPVVYDIQDLWPDTLDATGMLQNKTAIAIVSRVCAWVYSKVDHIVVLSPGFKRLLVERRVPEKKIDVIFNWADESTLRFPIDRNPEEAYSSNGFHLVFAGNMGKAQGLDTVLGAAKILQERQSRVEFIMIGGGVEVERLKRLSLDLDLNNVTFKPPVPMSEIGAFLSAADALLVHLKNNPLFRITIPSKTQAYMAVGKPLLMAVDGDAADLVRRSGGGVTTPSEDAEKMASAADALAHLSSEELKSLGIKAKKFYEENMSLEAGVTRFGMIFKGIYEKRTSLNS